MIGYDSDNMLSLLEGYTLTTPDTVGKEIADDFRKRRIEKNITRKNMAEMSDVALANITRFEQKGEISLHNLIRLAIALGYTGEIKSLFATPKYSTTEELLQIHRNAGKKKARSSKPTSSSQHHLIKPIP